MRLFSRRKEFHLDDPRLVGMSSLKTIDEGPKNSSPESPSPSTPAIDIDSTGVSSSKTSTSSGSSSPSKTVLMFLPTLQEQESHRKKWLSHSSACLVTSTGSADPNKSKPSQPHYQNPTQSQMLHQQGGNGTSPSLATWGKRVSLQWDTMRRAESTEGLTSGVISSTLNRRKTLHFYPDVDYSSSSSSKLSEKVFAAKEKFSTLKHSSSTSKIAQGQQPQEGKTGRKIGRVESLRILLSKGKGKPKVGKGVQNSNASGGTKVDKGTDTEDLPQGDFPGEELLEEEIFSSSANLRNFLYSSTSQLNSIGASSFTDESSATGSVTMRRASLCSDFSRGVPSGVGFRDSFMMKTTSCENLSSMTLNRNQPTKYFSNSEQTPQSSLHKSTSTGTMTVTGNEGHSSLTSVSSASSNSSGSTISKRSSFPYAYIRSKLTALPEEPNAANNAGGSSSTTSSPQKSSPQSSSSSASSSTSSTKEDSLPTRLSKPRRSLSQRGGFFHSMGDLLTRSSSNISSRDAELSVDTEEDDESMLMTMPCILRSSKRSKFGVNPRPNSIACPPGRRMFDPLTQIRIDLLHKNPSEFDDPSQSPQLWGRRSYSIGDILTESRKDMKSFMGSNTNVEESGYDSDSTRTGHESPRSSIKIPSSETDSEEQVVATSASRKAIPSLVTTHGKHLLDFDSESTISGGVDSSTSAPSPTGTNSSSESFDDVISSSAKYGPLAYVTLTRKELSSNQRKSSLQNGSMTSRTLPRSQSICSSSSPKIIERRRKASIDAGLTLPRRKKGGDNTDIENRENQPFISRTEVITVNGDHPGKLSLTSSVDIKSDGSASINQISAAPSLRLRNKVRDRIEWSTSRANRSQSLCLSIFSVKFEKGPNKKSLGFSVVGGKDSPKGSMGIFIKRIFPYGQASEEGNITEGDEILSVNGQSLSNATHTEALNIFKSIKSGEVVMQIARREMVKPTPAEVTPVPRPRSNSYLRSKSISCEALSERKV